MSELLKSSRFDADPAYREQLAEHKPAHISVEEFEHFRGPFKGQDFSPASEAAEPIQPGARDDSDALYRDAPRNADAAQAIAWIRKTIRLQTANEAVFDLLDEAHTPAYAESMRLALALAQRMQWPASWANAALQAEGGQAQRKAIEIRDAAEKAARRLVFERAPGQRVFDAAMAVFNRADYYPSREAVVALCRRIAQGGRGAPRHGRPR